jgi:hypothetical protein
VLRDFTNIFAHRQFENFHVREHIFLSSSCSL